jgi:uncharacterized protein YjbJ (UPF0337 family)
MNTDQFKGTANKVAGHVQKAVGDLADDANLQSEGVAREFAGKAQETYGNAVDTVRDYAERKPFGAIAVGVGVGVLVGMLLAARRGD